MSCLTITIIDVGWGDSILIESKDNANNSLYGLVDCNDKTTLRSSYIYIKRFLERQRVNLKNQPIFNFMLLTHGHADHGDGMQTMMRDFGTDWFWYPKSVATGSFAKIIQYANSHPQQVSRHQAIDNSKVLPNLGDVQLKVLWTPYNPAGPYDSSNENNNSIVLALTLGNASFLLTGDCEAENWPLIVGNLPAIPGLKVFKVPHHGAVNGVFSTTGSTPWLDVLAPDTKFAISSHVVPHSHPADKVVQEFANRQIQPFRTDLQYHLIFTTDGTLNAAGACDVTVQWSHI